jgi:indolepyruvate ferredoxin oxidoreductase
MIARRADFLAAYQDAEYAARYRARLDDFRATLPADAPEDALRAAARGLFKLMAVKDEYEVARLHGLAGFKEELAAKFEGDFRVHYHLAPPLLGRRKREFGPWMGVALRALARMKGLRGTIFDPFRYHGEARLNRDLLAWYEAALTRVAENWTAQNAADAMTVLTAPDDIRGFGPLRAESAEKSRRDAEIALARLAAPSALGKTG